MKEEEVSILQELIERRDNGGVSLGEEEQILRPFIDEINMITSHEIQLFVRSALVKAPIHFWISPAFIEDGLPPDTYDEGGNVLFTKRMVKIAMLLCVCYGAGIKGLDSRWPVSTYRDIVIAACLMHGLCKWQGTKGDEYTWQKYYQYAVDEYIKEDVEPIDRLVAENEQSSSLYLTEDIKQAIMTCIHSHQGRWSPIPETHPISLGSMVTHQAFFLAANFDLITEDLWTQAIPIDYLKDSG